MLKKLKLKKQTKALSLKKKKLNSLRKRVKAIKLERLRTFIPKDEIGRVYTLATDSPFYIAKDFMLRTMRAEIVRRFIYVGVVRARTHQAFRPLLSGYYRGLSFLDIDLITYYYRRTSRFLLILLLKNQRLCFISEELTKYFDRKAFIFNYHMIFDHWIPGTVSNYKILSKQKVRKEAHFIPRFPQVLLAIRLNPYKFYSIEQEARNAGVPMISFLDIDLDIGYFSYFFPLNMRFFTSFDYCLFLLTTLLRRVMLMKKKKFFKKSKFFKKKIK